MSVSLKALQSSIDSSLSDGEKTRWLFEDKTISRGVKLAPNELKIIAQDLKDAGFKAADVREWEKQVKAKKKNGISHIDIANIYIKGDKDLEQKAAKNRIMYSRASWHVYKAGLWEESEDWFVELEIQKLLESIEKKFGYQFTAGSQRSIISFVQQKLYIPVEKLDSRPEWVNVQNGVYDLEKMELIPHHPSQLLTRQMNVKYDPEARSTLWEMFKEDVIGAYGENGEWETDKQAINFLVEALGYSFTTEVKHEFMIWCIGEGRNGKGVLFNIIKTICGSSAMEINLNTLEKNAYQLAMIGGKSALLCTEADKKVDIANDGTIKAIVSGEGVMVRQIRERPFVLESRAKIWWSFNNSPNIRDTSAGFWRRVKLIPFNRNFDDRTADKDLKEKITTPEVLSAIFNDAIDAYNRVQASGEFSRSDLIENQTEEYKASENVVHSFIIDCCELDRDGKVGSSDIYREYKNWCFENGFMAHSIKNFKSEMTRLKFFPKRLAPGVFFHGIKLKPVKSVNATQGAWT